MIRIFDILFSFLGLLLLSPLLLILGIAVWVSSHGGIFYFQDRVGKEGKNFRLIKFRSMVPGADKGSGLTIGEGDPRITTVGKFLRRYKLDELPQLFNVLTGEMSIVGPRPELRKYVDLYTPSQRKVLEVRPGITDYASIDYFEENAILGSATDPEKAYIEVIMPAKISLNMTYISNPSVFNYFRIIWKTIKKIFS
ncbi:MAG: sugar transferase [Bacteroidota bacterium]|nr:sugar transferase [Bacteroidota bacterium]